MQIKLEGFKELDEALGELTKAAARGVVRRALIKAAQPMADLAKSLAPVDDGNLKESITVSTKATGADAGKAAFGAVLQGGGSRAEAVSALRDANQGKSFVEVYVGPGRHPQAIFQEFGTVHHGPQPFMRPAFDQDGRGFIDRLGVEMKAEIDKAAARAARKAARLAAKG